MLLGDSVAVLGQDEADRSRIENLQVIPSNPLPGDFRSVYRPSIRLETEMDLFAPTVLSYAYHR